MAYWARARAGRSVVPGHEAEAYFLGPGNVWAIRGNEVAEIEVSGRSAPATTWPPVVQRLTDVIVPKLGRH